MAKITGPHFKLPKAVKYQMANFVDSTKRHQFKEIMIDAIVAEISSAKKTRFKDDGKE